MTLLETPTADLDVAVAFFDALWADIDNGWVTLFSAKNGATKTDWFPAGDIDALATRAIARSNQEADVWFGVATRHDRLTSGRGGAEDCHQIAGLWLDLDVAGPNHRDSEDLPPSLDDAYTILTRFQHPPTLVIESGGGLQPWWFLDEPAVVDPELLRCWHQTWERIAAETGEWRIDKVSDPARVMRVPGTLNRKIPGQPVPVVIAECDPTRRYALSDLAELLDTTPPPPARSAPTTAHNPDDPRPGDEFNATHTGNDVLQAAGWHHHRNLPNGDTAWRRPGKPDPRTIHSAIAYNDGHICSYSDTVADTRLEKHRSYDPWGAHVAINHSGDHAEAARAWRQEHPGRPPAEDWSAFDDLTSDDQDPPTSGHGYVQINSRPLHKISAEITDALVAANDPPAIFVRAGTLVRVRTDENARPIIDILDRFPLRHRISLVTNTIRVTQEGKATHVPPPLDIVNDILAAPTWPFPALEAITELPTIRPDGTVHDTPGYDETTRRLYLPGGLTIPQIPAHPTRQQITDSVSLIGELLDDFPFETDSDRANAIGLLLTPLVRPAVHGQVPLALIDAPEPGTGKGLLANAISVVATGRPAAARPLARTDDEIRKMLTAVLVEGPVIVVLDNIEDAIRSPSLAAVLTTDEWTDRLLGRTETIAVPNRCAWVATGNNLSVGGDIGRRCYRIRLDAHQARPYTRTGFRHPDLLGWAQQHRGDLTAALLTIARAWWDAGRPDPDRLPVIGGFTPWAKTIAGILHHAGIDGFLANLEQLHSALDVESESWEGFLGALAEVFGDRKVTAADIATEIESEYSQLRYVVPAELVDSIGKPRLAKKLGEAFRRREGRRHGDSEIAVIEAGKNRNKTKLWSFVHHASFHKLTTAGTAGTAGTTFNQDEGGFGEPF